MNGDPAAFAGAPITDASGNFRGVVALQIPLDQVNAITGQRAGMRETGEVYLVGSDLKMRSDWYLDPVGHDVSAWLNGTVDKNDVDTEATRRAPEGGAVAAIIKSSNPN